jgi:hypothetical protein
MTDKYLTCIYCDSTLWKLDNKVHIIQYCADCANKHDVDITYLWHAPAQSWSMVWMCFSKGDMLYRVDTSPFFKKQRLLSIPKDEAKKHGYLMDINLQDDIRAIISPSKISLDHIKTFDMNFNSFIGPENIREKVNTLLLFI